MATKAHGNIPIDLMSGGLTTIEYEHHEIHDGDMFSATARTAVNALDIATPLTMMITTPDSDKLIHTVFSSSTSASAWLSIVESPTNATGGSTIVEYNRNRNSTSEATAVAVSAVTGSDLTGTEITNTIIGGGQRSGRYGGSTRSAEEWVLAANTSYVATLLSVADNNTGTLGIDWYEHTTTDT